MAEWQALHDAQHRVDQLQKQCKEALDAWRANPSSEIENKHYKGLNVSLHSAERILEKLTAAASTSGRHLWPGIEKVFVYCCMRSHIAFQHKTFEVHLATCISQG